MVRPTGPMNESSHSLISRSAPGFTLETADGQSIALSDLRGRPVVVFFAREFT